MERQSTERWTMTLWFLIAICRRRRHRHSSLISGECSSTNGLLSTLLINADIFLSHIHVLVPVCLSDKWVNNKKRLRPRSVNAYHCTHREHCNWCDKGAIHNTLPAFARISIRIMCAIEWPQNLLSSIPFTYRRLLSKLSGDGKLRLVPLQSLYTTKQKLYFCFLFSLYHMKSTQCRCRRYSSQRPYENETNDSHPTTIRILLPRIESLFSRGFLLAINSIKICFLFFVWCVLASVYVCLCIRCGWVGPRNFIFVCIRLIAATCQTSAIFFILLPKPIANEVGSHLHRTRQAFGSAKHRFAVDDDAFGGRLRCNRMYWNWFNAIADAQIDENIGEIAQFRLEMFHRYFAIITGTRLFYRHMLMTWHLTACVNVSNVNLLLFADFLKSFTWLQWKKSREKKITWL